MSDIAIVANEEFLFDFELIDANLLEDDGLETAILLSIFTDRRADISDDLAGIEDKRGWWGDSTLTGNDKIGSKIWLFDRNKLTSESSVIAQGYLFQCLKWLVEDDIAERIEIDVSLISISGTVKETLAADIKIYRKFGQLESYKFDDLWKAQIRKI